MLADKEFLKASKKTGKKSKTVEVDNIEAVDPWLNKEKPKVTYEHKYRISNLLQKLRKKMFILFVCFTVFHISK